MISCIILFSSHCCYACYVQNSYNYMLLITVYRWSLSMCHFLLVLIVYYDGNYHPLLKRSTSARLSSLPTSQETTDLYWKPYWNDESTLNCLVTEQHKLPVLPVLPVLRCFWCFRCHVRSKRPSPWRPVKLSWFPSRRKLWCLGHPCPRDALINLVRFRAQRIEKTDVLGKSWNVLWRSAGLWTFGHLDIIRTPTN